MSDDPVKRAARAIREAAVYCQQVHGYKYGDFHVIRDLNLPPGEQEIFRAPYDNELRQQQFDAVHDAIKARAAIASLRTPSDAMKSAIAAEMRTVESIVTLHAIRTGSNIEYKDGIPPLWRAWAAGIDAALSCPARRERARTGMRIMDDRSSELASQIADLKRQKRAGRRHVRKLVTLSAATVERILELQLAEQEPSTSTMMRRLIEDGLDWHDSIQPMARRMMRP